jgi:hypothetical protein
MQPNQSCSLSCMNVDDTCGSWKYSTSSKRYRGLVPRVTRQGARILRRPKRVKHSLSAFLSEHHSEGNSFRMLELPQTTLSNRYCRLQYSQTMFQYILHFSRFRCLGVREYPPLYNQSHQATKTPLPGPSIGSTPTSHAAPAISPLAASA